MESFMNFDADNSMLRLEDPHKSTQLLGSGCAILRSDS
jgi:hypothetical protein